ncbi:MAG: ABC transporter permease [Eubacteriales bacterium]|nr:ABC transporter permease [Eubacteriales bacterium]
MSQFLEYLKIALMNIRSNKGRSFLTMLGIIIGISSVIMIISVGNGIKAEVNDELNEMSGGLVAIYTDSSMGTGDPIYFTEEDFDAIAEKVPHVKGVTPVYTLYATTSTRKGSFDVMMSCGTAGMKDYSKDPIVKGRFFSESDYYGAKRVCVITESTARKMFGTTDVLGMTLDVDVYGTSQEYEIVGIRKDSAAGLINSMSSGGMQTMEVPISTIESFGFYVSDFTDFYIIGESNEYGAQIAQDSVSLLEKRHNARGSGAIMVQSFNDALAQVNSVLNYITLFVVLVAAISLLVGGIGVMNIMLVSVTERTREIGIRKALGARTASVLLQFLSESAIITLMGGLIGILLGVLGAVGICSLIGFSAQVKISTVLGASVFSSAVGIFFGIYPARKAAKMSPIEALRYE